MFDAGATLRHRPSASIVPAARLRRCPELAMHTLARAERCGAQIEAVEAQDVEGVVKRASRLVGLEGMLEQPEMTDAVLIACVTRHRLLPSRPGEFHPEPLTDPDLSLST